MSIFNWIKEKEYLVESTIQDHSGFVLKTGELPESVDLRPYCSPVENQGHIGSCTGNALVGALEYLENKDKDLENGGSFVDLSRLFVYFNERLIENDVSVDGGAVISDGITVLKTYGVCTEKTWPYVETSFNIKPSPEAYTEASSRKITAAAKVDSSNIYNIKQALASGYPIVFGFQVYQSFEEEKMAETGVLYIPESNERCMGGHAVLIVGYDDKQQRVIVRNSWGAQWGQSGYFTMPYEYVTNPNLASDFWSITK